MAKIIVNNIATEYQDEGKGDVILFLHGWQVDLHTFDRIVSNLSDSYRIVRLDLPGFGKTEAPKTTWGVRDYAVFVSKFVKKLNLDINTVVGHSFGGRIILKGETEADFESDKIVLIASAGLSENRTFRNVIFRFLAKIGGLLTYIPPLIFWRQDIRRMLYNFLRSDYMDSDQLRETFLKVIKEDLSENAKRINKPTLLIWGDRDIVTPLSDGKKLNELIPNSKLKIIKNVGHFVHIKEFKKVSNLIDNFISDQ